MKSQKEYKIQQALGTLPIFVVERTDRQDITNKENNLFLQLDEKGNESWFLAATIYATSPTDAINRVIKERKFPEEVRQYLYAYVYTVGRDPYIDSWLNNDDD